MRLASSSGLIFPEDRRAGSRLFCFHHAGGGASAYRSWVTLLAPAVEVVRVQLPGRESRFSEPPFDRFADAVEALAREIAAWTDRPYALFGHSFGALLAFEIARRLSGDRGPCALVVSGHGAPGRGAEGGTRSARLGDEEFLALLAGYDGTPHEVISNSEIRALYLPIMQRDLALAESYVPEPGARVDCPLLILGGLSDPKAEPRALEGWAAFTAGTATVRTFEGGHFYFRGREREVCPVVADFLAQAPGAATAGLPAGSGSSRLP